MKKVIVATFLLLLSTLACGKGSGSSDTEPFKFWTPTSNATQTPIILQITTTPLPTQTPEIIILVATATFPSDRLCVIADEAVYLRPSASDDGYPITPLMKGSEVINLGGQNGDWVYVQYTTVDGEIMTGYAYTNWLGECDS